MGQKFNDQMMFSKTLRERLDMESEMDANIGHSEQVHWCAFMPLSNGQMIIERNYDPCLDSLDIGLQRDPTAEQMVWAQAAVKFLNKECAHNGRWVIAWTHPPSVGELLSVEPRYEWKRLIKVWLDADGDPAFTTDNVDPFYAIIEMEHEYFAKQSDEAWNKWFTIMRQALDPKEHQLKPLALIRG